MGSILLFGNKFCMVGQKTVSYIKILRGLIETSVILQEKEKPHLEYVALCNQEAWRTWKVLDYLRGRFLFLLCWKTFPQLRSLSRPLHQQIFPSMSAMEANHFGVAPICSQFTLKKKRKKSVNLQVGQDNHLLLAQRARGVLEDLGHPDEGRKKQLRWMPIQLLAGKFPWKWNFFVSIL